MFSKLLIANRGEIACRIVRTARRLGIATVAVYSDADADALHVRVADTAIRIGAAAARESYLDGGAIIAAAKRAGADCRASGLRVPVRGCGIRGGLHGGWARLGRPAAFRHARNGLQIGGKGADGEIGGAGPAGLSRRRSGAGAARAGGGSDRLSRGDQGCRGRRRTRHAGRAERRGLRGGARLRAAGGALRIRRFARADRALSRAAAPHRDAGVRRRAWQRGPSLRARLLGAAAPSEGDRGGARPGARRA